MSIFSCDSSSIHGNVGRLVGRSVGRSVGVNAFQEVGIALKVHVMSMFKHILCSIMHVCCMMCTCIIKFYLR